MRRIKFEIQRIKLEIRRLKLEIQRIIENSKNKVGNSTAQVCDIRSILCLLFVYWWQCNVEQGSNEYICK